MQFGEITLAPAGDRADDVTIHSGCRVIEIYREARDVRTADGRTWAYRTLVLATGSRAFVPQISGIGTMGAYRFRTADDVSALFGAHLFVAPCHVHWRRALGP